MNLPELKHDVDAEQRLIGRLMIAGRDGDDDCLDLIFSLDADAFFNAQFRSIFSAAKAMRGQRIVGAVSGSVSITKAKNSSGFATSAKYRFSAIRKPISLKKSPRILNGIEMRKPTKLRTLARTPITMATKSSASATRRRQRRDGFSAFAGAALSVKKAYSRGAWKVLHWFMSPVSNPRLNQRTR